MKFIFPQTIFADIPRNTCGVFVEVSDRYEDDPPNVTSSKRVIAATWYKHGANSGNSNVPILVDISSDRGLELVEFPLFCGIRLPVLGDEGEIVVFEDNLVNLGKKVYQTFMADFVDKKEIP